MAGKQTVTASTNTLLAGLKRTVQWDTGDLTSYIADSGDAATIAAVYQNRIGSAPSGTYDPYTSTDAAEAPWLTAIARAEAAFSLVADISFTAATDIDDADIVYGGGYNSLGGGTIARMDAPGENLKSGETDDYQSFFLAVMNDARYDVAGETGGGSSPDFIVLHELGHGLGLSHPHNSDRGTTAWANSGAVATDNKADNARYTVMSYEIGGIDVQILDNFGNSVTPAALDIATLQDIYGTRAAHTGDTTYTLTDQGTTALDLSGGDGSISIGRAFYTIWDTGGDGDKIAYNGAQNAYINLNDATLVQEEQPEDAALLKEVKLTNAYADMAGRVGSQPLNELTDADYHAGGYYSTLATAAGNTQLGGYSIANGVVIEDATGGSGKDMLIGNAANNTLTGNAGDDMLAGGRGADELKGGAGDDELVGGEGNDTLEGGAGTDTAYYDGPCASYTIERDDATGEVTITHKAGLDGIDTLMDVEFAKFTDGTIDLTAEEIEDCPPLDFIFLVDLSGSFSDDLFSFRAAAREIAADLRAENEDVRFAIASFIDYPFSPYGSEGDYLYKAELALTDDVAAFEATLDGLSTGSGGDGPEAQWVGLWRAANGVGLNLREDSSRVIYMATDAPAHTASDYGLDETNIRNFLETGEIDVEGGPDGLATTGGRGGATATGSTGDGSGLEIPPDQPTIRDPGDPGYDIGAPVERLADDPLVALVGESFREMGAIPIIGTTRFGSGEVYEEALSDLGSGGVVVETTSSGADVTDAIRAGLARISGDVTEIGTSAGEEINGTEGRDVLLGLGGDDTITGLGGDDSLDGSAGNDELVGGDGNDTINGGTGDDDIAGGDGDDLLRPGTGADTITGGAGMDLVSGSASAIDGTHFADFGREDAVIIEGVDAPAPFLTITEIDGLATFLVDFDNSDAFVDVTFTADATALGVGAQMFLRGGNLEIGRVLTDGTTAADTIMGNPVNNFLNGLEGADTIFGGAGRDWITPGQGDDDLDGGSGRDMVSYFDATARVAVNLEDGTSVGGSGTDTLTSFEDVTGSIYSDLFFGTSGENQFRGLGGYDWFVGSDGRDVYEGGSGRDMISYVLADDRVEVDLGGGRGIGGQALGDTYDSIERFTGSIFSDLAYGSEGEDDFRGLGGYDWFVGSGGGKDRYDGGSGLDTVAYSLATEGVVASLLLGRGTAGDAARDLYTSIESLTGSSFDDILTGNNGRNFLRGLYGEDVIYGNGGVDRITGGGSDDYIDGGSGFDYAYFSGNEDEYAIDMRDGFVFVEYLGSGGDGTDQLVNIEALVFADDTVFL
ncbi:M10 family metallopeptidase C-terminal domain-containing protein [Sulfitobacter sp. HNIBRBA3233]|uniref:M10 family metallopeptidase C-terminal domain-containing protein n=1 Tax=Sulfitobacter marinivivus TaxID=3158558 RepID=UPI0032DF9685